MITVDPAVPKSSVPCKIHLQGESSNSFHGIAPLPYRRWLAIKTIAAAVLLLNVLYRESLSSLYA